MKKSLQLDSEVTLSVDRTYLSLSDKNVGIKLYLLYEVVGDRSSDVEWCVGILLSGAQEEGLVEKTGEFGRVTESRSRMRRSGLEGGGR